MMRGGAGATFGERSGILFSMLRESLSICLLASLFTIFGVAQSPPKQSDHARSPDQRAENKSDHKSDQKAAEESPQSGLAKVENGENGSDKSADAGPKPSNWLWSLTIRNRTGWRTNAPRRAQMSRNYVDAKGVYRIDETWSLTLEGRAHYDPVGRLGYPPRLWLDPRQALLDGRIGKVDLKLGLQQVVWGQADGLRVLDVINPLDYREFILEDFLDSRRPLWMARVDLPVGSGAIQFLWIPYFVPGRIPTGSDEFSLSRLAINGPSGSTAPPGTPTTSPLTELLPTRRPAYRLGSSQAGLRYSRTVGRWDLTANYFKGWEDLPTPYTTGPRAGSEGAWSLLIEPRHERKEVFGGTAANSFGAFVLRMEAGLSRHRPVAVSSAALPGPTLPTGYARLDQFSGVVGLDYAARPWLWLSGQYFLQSTIGGNFPLALPRHNHLMSFYVRTNFQRETLRPELFILTGINERQYMFRPRLVKSLDDHWSIGFGFDLLGGDRRNLFGSFGRQDRAVVELKWMR